MLADDDGEDDDDDIGAVTDDSMESSFDATGDLVGPFALAGERVVLEELSLMPFMAIAIFSSMDRISGLALASSAISQLQTPRFLSCSD